MVSTCLEDGVFPREWKAARVVVLLKSPEKLRSDPGSYRGICLLSALGKVLERIMIDRLMDTLGGRFSRWQFGFQTRRSCDDAWMHVKQTVAASDSKYVMGIFVDFKGAFDHLEWSSIMRRLQEVGCREMAIWRNYFSGRTAKAVTTLDSVEWQVRRGCPQGSIVGPYVWNLMMDVLLLELESRCKFCAYADDLLLMVEGNSRKQLEDRSTELMSVVTHWGRSSGVEVSGSKTVSMLLKGHLSRNRPIYVRYGTNTVQYVYEVKYLGLTIGERLNFQPHLKQMSHRMCGAVQELKRVLRVDHGLNRRAVRRIYKGLFTPCAMFGAAIWYKTAQTKTGASNLLSCQRIPLLACLAVCRTVSTDALQVLAGAMPWDLEATRVAIAYKVKRGLPLEPEETFAEELPPADLKKLLLEHFLDKWQMRWEESTKGRTTFRFLPEVRFTFEIPDFGFRLSAGFLLTGHGSIGEFLNKRRLQQTEACNCGAAVEDVWHILCFCPNYADIRNLAEMGIDYDGTSFNVAKCCATPDTLKKLEDFAMVAFTRRFLIRRNDTRRLVYNF